MGKKTIAAQKKVRIIRHNGKPRVVVLPIKDYKALHRLIEDLRDSLEIEIAQNEVRTGKDKLHSYRQVRSTLRAKGKL